MAPVPRHPRIRERKLHPLNVVRFQIAEDSIAETKEHECSARPLCRDSGRSEILSTERTAFTSSCESLGDARSVRMASRSRPDPVASLFSDCAMHVHRVCDDVGKNTRVPPPSRTTGCRACRAPHPIPEGVLEPFEAIVVVKIRLEVRHAIKKGIKPRIDFRDAPLP